MIWDNPTCLLIVTSPIYTGALIRFQSTSGREAGSNPPIDVDCINPDWTRLVGIYTQGELGLKRIETRLELQV